MQKDDFIRQAIYLLDESEITPWNPFEIKDKTDILSKAKKCLQNIKVFIDIVDIFDIYRRIMYKLFLNFYAFIFFIMRYYTPIFFLFEFIGLRKCSNSSGSNKFFSFM